MNHRPADRGADGARRRRPSRQQYLVRRTVVGGGALVVVLVLGLGVRAAFGGSGDGDREGGSTSSTDPNGSSAGPPIGPTPTPALPRVTATTAGSTTTSSTQPSGPPSAANPATVLVVGDSNAGTFGPYLAELVDGFGVAETIVDYKVSSGLSRPDFFDWPAHLRQQLAETDPDVVVVTYGGNDAQGLASARGDFAAEYNDPISDEEAWKAEYARRVGEVLDVLLEDGRSVVWVGIPNAEDPEVTARMAVQDAAAKSAVALRPDVVFVDTWARFSGRSGNWAEFVVDPRDGVGKDVRADEDGFHLNENGAEILALDIANVVRADLVERGAEI